MGKYTPMESYGYRETNDFSSIRTLLDDEIMANRKTDEQQTADINTESDERKEADVEINDKISSIEEDVQELQDKYDDFEASIEEEESRAISAETALDEKLTGEINRASAAEVELQNALDVLNGDGAGSINQKVTDAVAQIVADAPEDFDTLKEVADYIAADKTNAAEIEVKLSEHTEEINANAASISANAASIESLNANVSALEESDAAISADVQTKSEELSALISDETNRASTKEAEIEAEMATKADNEDLEALSASTDELDARITNAEQSIGSVEDAFSAFTSTTYPNDKAVIEETINALQSELEASLPMKADVSAVTELSESVNEMGSALEGKADNSAVTSVSEALAELEELVGTKVSVSEFDEYKEFVDATFLKEHQSLEDYAKSSAVTEEIAIAVEPLATTEELEALKVRVQNIERYISGAEDGTSINNQVVEDMLKDNKSVTITNGKVSVVNVPDTTQIKTVNATFADGAVVNLTSSKSIYLNSLSDEPISELILNAPSATASTIFYLSANCETVKVTNGSLSVGSAYSVTNIELITDGEEETSSISITAKFNQDATITSESSNPITINSRNTAEDNINLAINAPNSTVTLNSHWNEVESNVSDDTLYVGQTAFINKLTVVKGNVVVKDVDINNRIGQVINDTDYSVSVATYEATDAQSLSKGIQSNGITNVMNDITLTTSIGYGILASGNYQLNLNGYNVQVGNTKQGILTRGSMTLNIYGDGKLFNPSSYMLWADGSSTINVHGGEYVGETHCLYVSSKTATINVYGGDFKLSNADKKYLVNYLDSVWDANNKRIHLYGGKFYGFDPSNSMGEPNGPVNLLEDGYHVVHTVVDGEDVYEVVED